VRTELLQHANETAGAKTTTTFVVLEESKDRVYVAQSGLIGGDFPTHKTVMTPSGERQLKDGANELTVKFESPVQGGVKLVKTYTLKRGAYDIPVKHEVVNTGSAPLAPQLYVQLVRDGNTTGGGSFFTNPTGTFTGPAVYTEQQKFQKVDFSAVEKNKADFQKDATNGYVAMVQHYFASAWILPDGVKRENFVRKVDTNL
jgi:YidC/Oxa1 family membrane protein insertase